MTDHQVGTYATVEAIFATLMASGVTDVVVSPGSRSTALAVTAAALPDLAVTIVLDERSAGFVALGMATVTDRPVALVCTSGSAAANYLPAVVEANRGRVRLAVVTADRPAGFLERDTPQTIHQTNLYGTHVLASVQLPSAHEADPDRVAYDVGEAMAAMGVRAGPVHINCPFDKPLEPADGWKPTGEIGSSRGAVVASPSAEDVTTLTAFLASTERGLIVAGPRRATNDELDAVAKCGWTVLADPLSGFRSGRHDVVTGAELLLRSESFVASHLPHAIIRFGGTPTGRATQQWIDTLDVPVLIVDPDYRWLFDGPERVVRGDVGLLFDAGVAAAAADDGVDHAWRESWRDAQRRVVDARETERREHPDSELSITGAVIDSEPSILWVASSMPIRHVDVMLGRSNATMVWSNRGANGIDGTIASATGAALGSGQAVTALLGDLAFLHDAGSLTSAMEVGVDLTLVVIDNRGGAIFAMLPVSARDDVDFERLFTTPHTRDLVAIAAGFGADARRVHARDLRDALTPQGGVRVLVVDADPSDTHEAYRRMVAQ